MRGGHADGFPKGNRAWLELRFTCGRRGTIGCDLEGLQSAWAGAVVFRGGMIPITLMYPYEHGSPLYPGCVGSFLLR